MRDLQNMDCYIRGTGWTNRTVRWRHCDLVQDRVTRLQDGALCELVQDRVTGLQDGTLCDFVQDRLVTVPIHSVYS